MKPISLKNIKSLLNMLGCNVVNMETYDGVADNEMYKEFISIQDAIDANIDGSIDTLINHTNVNINKALCIAAYNGKLEAMKYLIKKGAVDLSTALFFATCNQKHEVIEFLINIKKAHKEKALFMAAILIARENLESMENVVKLLIEKKANVNITLLIAAFYGEQETAQWLIAKGADVNEALSIAASRGGQETAQWLIAQGADVNKALSIAIEALDIKQTLEQCTKAINLLIYNGANKEAAAEYLKTVGADINEALYVAASHGRQESAQWLIAKGADVNEALSIAASRGKQEAAEWLIAQGANVNKALSIALFASKQTKEQREQSGQAIVLLTNNGANKEDALINLANAHERELMNVCIGQGGDINEALFKAVSSKKNKSTISLLLKKGAEIYKAFYKAVMEENLDAISIFEQEYYPKERILVDLVENKEFEAAKLLLPKIGEEKALDMIKSCKNKEVFLAFMNLAEKEGIAKLGNLEDEEVNIPVDNGDDDADGGSSGQLVGIKRPLSVTEVIEENSDTNTAKKNKSNVESSDQGSLENNGSLDENQVSSLENNTSQRKHEHTVEHEDNNAQKQLGMFELIVLKQGFSIDDIKTEFQRLQEEEKAIIEEIKVSAEKAEKVTKQNVDAQQDVDHSFVKIQSEEGEIKIKQPSSLFDIGKSFIEGLYSLLKDLGEPSYILTDKAGMSSFSISYDDGLPKPCFNDIPGQINNELQHYDYE